MKFREVRQRSYSSDRTFTGKKNGIEVNVNWSDYRKYWCFTAHLPNDERFNSLWIDVCFAKQEECEAYAETYCDHNATTK